MPAVKPKAEVKPMLGCFTHMDLQLLFRRIVIANVLVYVAWFVVPMVDARFLSSETLDAVLWSGAGALLPLSKSVKWLFFSLYIAAAIGLCGFIPSARWLFVALAIFQYSWVLFSGVSAGTALDAFLSGINALGDGAIITLAFMPGLREKFVSDDDEAT